MLPQNMTRKPSRNLPKGAIIGLVVVAVGLVLFGVVAMQDAPASQVTTVDIPLQ